MKAVLRARFFLGLGVTIIGAYAFYDSWHWPYKAALFPRLISVPLFLFGLLETSLSLSKAEEKKEGAAVDFEFSTDVDPITARKRTLSLFLWVLGFFALIPLVGFLIAVPLFIFLSLKLEGKESWLVSIVLTACCWLFMEGLFNRLLHIPFAPGWLSFLWSS